MNKTVENNENLIETNPKKAIITLSIPIIVSLIFAMLNNVIDSAWVSGLGPNALAAVGFVTPLFMAIVGLGNGLGAGANSVISRSIGKKDLKQANNAVAHSVIFITIFTIIVTTVLLLFLDNILLGLGAKSVMELARSYGWWIIFGLFSFLIPNVFAGILRSEGFVKRATYPIIGSAILNMIIDPIFIYTLNMGVSGAAIATIISQVLIAVIPMVYWVLIKRDGTVKVSPKDYKHDLKLYRDILIVGVPASLEEIIMSALSGFVNGSLAIISGTTGVAVFSASWRLVGLGITPAMGVGIAAITVIGTAYGAENWDNLKVGFTSAIEFSIMLSGLVFVLFFIFAGQLSELFSHSGSSGNLAPLITDAIRVLGIYILTMPMGLVAANYFQSIGKGITSLVITFLRELIIIISTIAIFVLVLNWGELGVYWGIIVGGTLGSVIGYLIAKRDVGKLLKKANY